ncbi:hypothetical protein LEMLEM_LOCUS8374 [Lemmus lemmus]
MAFLIKKKFNMIKKYPRKIKKRLWNLQRIGQHPIPQNGNK